MIHKIRGWPLNNSPLFTSVTFCMRPSIDVIWCVTMLSRFMANFVTQPLFFKDCNDFCLKESIKKYKDIFACDHCWGEEKRGKTLIISFSSVQTDIFWCWAKSKGWGIRFSRISQLLCGQTLRHLYWGTCILRHFYIGLVLRHLYGSSSISRKAFHANAKRKTVFSFIWLYFFSSCTQFSLLLSAKTNECLFYMQSNQVSYYLHLMILKTWA